MYFRPESGKMTKLKTLSGEQRRQLIDTQQAYEAWHAANAAAKHRFAGSMRWAQRGQKRIPSKKN